MKPEPATRFFLTVVGYETGRPFFMGGFPAQEDATREGDRLVGAKFAGGYQVTTRPVL